MSTNQAKLNSFTTSTQPAGKVAPARQHYDPPTLTVYGSLTQWTQTVGNDGADGTLGTRQTT